MSADPILTDEALAAAGVGVEHHWVADEVYAKRTLVPAGRWLLQHSHTYDHASALVSGTARITVDGKSQTLTGPRMLLIRAGSQHRIEALTDLIFHCIHIVDDTDPATVDASILGRT